MTKTRLKDQLLIYLLALLIGLIVGTIDYIFGQGLLLISAFRTQHFIFLIPFLALAGLAMTYLYQRFGGKAKAGMALVFDVGHGREKEIPLVLIPLITISTWLTHLFGASAGREGVAVQIGATVSHFFSKYIKSENSSRLFLVMGMAAGFAGLFQTPTAAILFAIELLLINHIYFSALVPTVIAAFTASYTSHFLGLEKFEVMLTNAPSLSLELFIKLMLLGLIFAFAGNSFAISLAFLKTKLATLIENPYKRIAMVGLGLSICLTVMHFGRYSGLGTNLIADTFAGKEIYAYDWFFKLLFTVITIAAGYQGGEVTPLFAIGTSLGAVLAPLFGLPIEMVAALGYVAVFSSATNTFFGPLFIAFEVFGPDHFVLFFITLVFAYSIDRKHSIYNKQESLSLPK